MFFLHAFRDSIYSISKAEYVKNGNTKTWSLDLTEYVRHQIHHPENHNNVHFTGAELKQSIEDMRNYIRSQAEAEEIREPISDDE